MAGLKRVAKRLVKDESGAVATEYVIVVGLIAVALITVIVAFRDDLARVWNDLGGKVSQEHQEGQVQDIEVPTAGGS